MLLFDEFIENVPLKIFKCDDEEIKLGKKLGEGITAEVYKLVLHDCEYAGKVYENPNLEDILYELNVAKELEGTEQCVRTYGIIVCNEEKIILLMELLKSYGDLYDYTSKVAKWTPCYLQGSSKDNKLIPKPKSEYIYYPI